MVDNASVTGAPVHLEDNPSLQRLVGRIEHFAHFGTLLTDFALLAPGALHRANGGYLVLDAEKILTAPFGWDALKRALRSSEIRIQSADQILSFATTVSLDPEPVPLNLKVILIGSPLLYQLLSEFDPEFPELFKIAADFDDRIEWTDANALELARLLGSIARRRGAKPLTRAAAARTVEFASRYAGDTGKLATRLRDLSDLIDEADQMARDEGQEVIGPSHIEGAIDARLRRADRIYQRMQEEIRRQTHRIETAGEVIGQVNGLAVYQFGRVAFGLPSRITASVRLGKGDVIDIEREVALGGPLHSKGVLILSGFLAGHFARRQPLALTASIVFEQSYGAVEGDSASTAELFALLSAIGEIPIKQCLAVTGSIDQHGLVQAIGGVNEKIEGFFDLCKARGFSGREGVLIPTANTKHLMLREDVVEAARKGAFQIYAIDSVDDGMELLTGLPAGVPDLSGNYPEGTVNHCIATHLASFVSRAAEHAKSTRFPARPKRHRRDADV